MQRALGQVEPPRQHSGASAMLAGAGAAASPAPPASGGTAREVPLPPQQRKMQKQRQNSAPEALELLRQQKGRADPDASRRHAIAAVPRASAE